jgi:CheY-like chemotaxis protein
MLVAEDREDDVQIFKMALARAKVNLPVQFVANGEEAIHYLQGEGRFANRDKYPMPRVLLLDLSMPLRNGFDVLEWLRLQPGLRRLLVVVFTSSDLAEDVNRAFDLGANSYLVKPSRFDKLEEIVRRLEDYWLKLNCCPDCTIESSRPGPEMRVVLRDPETRQYFQGPNTWTEDPEEALNFERSQRATQTALRIKLPRFEIIVEMVDEENRSEEDRRIASCE